MIAGLLLSAFALGGLCGTAAAEDFEPADFNVTSELLKLGVDVSKLPGLSGLGGRDVSAPCTAACKSLSALYGDNAVYAQNTTGYGAFTSAYWSSIQSEVDPLCIFKPAKVADVSVLVLLSRLTQCPFAFKSGGHAAFAGASSVEGGITVSFENFKDVTVSRDRKTVKIQPGNNWVDVYKVLDPQDLTVTGGRVARVGTGGLTLGGGISYFSNIYGWACDNVVSYEVVTASGRVVHATPTAFPKLYWALRGGGNNFGIVTSFTFETIPLPKGQMWGGTRTYLESNFEGVVDAFAGVIANSPSDPNAGIWVAWILKYGLKLAATELYYAKPDGAANATIFNDFKAMTPIADTTKSRNVSEYSEAQQSTNPYGLREVYWCMTVKADARIARVARDIYYQERPAVANIEGAGPVLIFQGITVGQMQKMSRNGGNALGLDHRDGPLYLIQIACWWKNAADDEAIYAFARKVMDRIAAEATALGVQSDYIYMNYGSRFQNVIAGYGADNVNKLRDIARQYDPKAVFQTLQPGHFKLDRAPVSS
ncbi:hypothetical protein JDV02_003768 [Purpureocillium takamizusanense]|uniref:FAD-binding PCMH-type domain-containing protein n=1 Tax=Purpureocillium takamizusanense TaxID=2060973 RepID=A0A9Q8QD17_9HYPO|nr:uncharacterized protein JDV02_003768 [Purpureocillium takamizusanense]UNI17425.1 hypothetical protein JDV02_003768 [Purpureocillium takamizusanense]